LIQYKLGGKYLGDAGLHPVPAANPAQAAVQKLWLSIGVVATAAAIGALALLSVSGVVVVTAEGIANIVGVLLIVLSLGVFAGCCAPETGPGGEEALHRDYCALLASALFWSAFEQAGSTLNLFAERSTDKVILGYAYPASWFHPSILFSSFLSRRFCLLWCARRYPARPNFLGLIFVGWDSS